MSLSNDYGSTWPTAEPYASIKTWQLTAEKGFKDVWARFTDANGHSTDVFDFINYDPTYEILIRDDIAARDGDMNYASCPVGSGMSILFRTTAGYLGKMRIMSTGSTLMFEETVYSVDGYVIYAAMSASVTDGNYFHLEGGFQSVFPAGSDSLWSSGMVQPIKDRFCPFWRCRRNGQ
jgi:hypothetical protein